MKKYCTAVIVLALGILVLSSSLQAAIEEIVWGDFVGIEVKFLDVRESSATDTLDINGDGTLDNSNTSVDGLYGRPTLVGDSLVFGNLNFFSSSSGFESDITDGKLEGTIQGKPNSYVDTIHFQEWGDVSLSGFSPANAYASIGNTYFLTITEIDDLALQDYLEFQIDMVVSPSDGDWLLSTDGFFTNREWTGELFFDITQALRDIGVDGYATDVFFAMDNTLTTQSSEGGSAYIAKKQTDGLKVTVEVLPDPIPEPATLMLLGLGGLLLRRKKA